MRTYFIQTPRIGFSYWTKEDLPLAQKLWGKANVTKYIAKSGIFTDKDIIDRLNTEIKNYKLYHVQYWPIFEISSTEFLGVCGLRPFKNEPNAYEMGFHLCETAWGKGFATESADAVIKYAFSSICADAIYAGHHPNNDNSKKVLLKLNFTYIGDNYYEPTGLMHPSYKITKPH